MKPVIKLAEIHKTYQTGEVEVKAVRGVSLEIFRANLSRSWARAVRENPR